MKRKNIYTDEERYWMTGGNTGTLPTRIIPSVIYSLAPNEIFVFGSNALGMQHAGAARVAYNEFGAEWGNGEGLQGQSYSIPTMEGEHSTKLAVMRFTQYARVHPELKFLVTPVGCGIAGYTPEEMAPMFKDAAYLENVYLPISFWKVLMGSRGNKSNLRKSSMGQFKVHVQYIIYGCCAIELLIGDKLIKCDAGYGGPNPLASLIVACLDFFTAKKQGFETEDYIEETETTWDEEPGEMHLGLKLLKNDMVIMDIQQRDDEKNVLQEWHETVPYEDFKEAIVSEGFRVLNAFGIFGYYAAWSAHEDFPLAALLRLTGNIELNWDGDNCFTDLSKELACLSSSES